MHCCIALCFNIYKVPKAEGITMLKTCAVIANMLVQSVLFCDRNEMHVCSCIRVL